MSNLNYHIVANHIRVVHARNEKYLNTVLKTKPESGQIKLLEDSLKRLDDCTVHFYQTEKKVSETGLKLNEVELELLQTKAVLNKKKQEIVKLEKQLNDLKKNLEL